MSPRPWDPDVPKETRECKVHGWTFHARHRNGKTKAGAQRYCWRCLRCNDEKVEDWRAGRDR